MRLKVVHFKRCFFLIFVQIFGVWFFLYFIFLLNTQLLLFKRAKCIFLFCNFYKKKKDSSAVNGKLQKHSNKVRIHNKHFVVHLKLSRVLDIGARKKGNCLHLNILNKIIIWQFCIIWFFQSKFRFCAVI